MWFQLFVEDLLIRGATKTFMINHVDGDWYQAQGSPTSFSNVSLPGHPRKSADALRTWLDKRISEPGALEEFAKGSKPVEWAESGIRPYTKEEVDANRTYLGLGAQIAEAKETLEVGIFNSYYTLTYLYNVDMQGSRGVWRRRDKHSHHKSWYVRILPCW